MKTRLLALICLLVLLASCAGKLAHKDSTPEGPAAAVETHTYDAVGVVKELNLKQSLIKIDHEDIKGLMPAMEMEFHVKYESELAGLGPGDRIEFKVESGVEGMLITSIRKVR